MKPKSFMLIAGEPSGDLLAAELVQALREEFAKAAPAATTDYQPLHGGLAPRFFGAGGPRMGAAGMQLAFDMTEHSVIGLSDVFKNYLKFRRLFGQLYRLAIQRQPDVIICIDFSGFNRRFAHAIKKYARARQDWFHDWDPKLVQYVSPQVWASREGRAYQMARDYELVLSIFPFEPDWYAKRTPTLLVEFVGNPLADRYSGLRSPSSPEVKTASDAPVVLLLPGSRESEVTRHLPVLLRALDILRASFPGLRGQIVLPSEGLAQRAKNFGLHDYVEATIGGLAIALGKADIALACTGTVTMECAWFGVPTIALYKTSWTNYQIGKRMVTVKYLAMPNLLANEELFPEFIQDAATPDNLARAAMQLLGDASRRETVKRKLAKIVSTLGSPGASGRAAKAILRLLNNR